MQKAFLSQHRFPSVNLKKKIIDLVNSLAAGENQPALITLLACLGTGLQFLSLMLRGQTPG